MIQFRSGPVEFFFQSVKDFLVAPAVSSAHGLLNVIVVAQILRDLPPRSRDAQSSRLHIGIAQCHRQRRLQTRRATADLAADGYAQTDVAAAASGGLVGPGQTGPPDGK